MFKDILRLWRGESFLSKVVDDFKNMLEQSHWIFDKATKVLWKEIPADEVHAEIYSRDRKINEEEQRIRRRLVEHLAINPRHDFPACLVFMSVIKDAERIGDYCKNIFEISNILKSPLDDKLAISLKDIEVQIGLNLAEISSAFVDANNKKAVKLMRQHGKISAACESVIRSMVTQEISVDKAVCYTLLLRYYKRISAHIANIASSIVNPIEKIDYVIEGLL
ncbi:phosphate uptake regulator PhoU [Candidatus Omnitrophota bacterium]